MNARLSIVAVCAGAALAVTGCGSTAAPSAQSTTTTTTQPAGDPVKWAGAFCSGTTPVLTGAVELITVFAANAENPPAMKEGMLKLLDTGGTAMAATEKKLKEVGAPAPEHQALHDELVKMFGDGAKEYVAVREQISKIDANSPDFMAQVEKIGGDSADPSKLSEQIKKLDADPKLKDAISKSPECTEMRTKLGELIGQ
ncbi:hypothetical protein [Lentzea sp. E54]|uniref:hypothetical protein n=1 Tax=Lentzea xerophila TaxID=3435883 RepID=UPI003DA60635